MTYDIGKLPLDAIIGPMAKATEALARLDERLARSPLREGWIARLHFHDAAAALWAEGELVHIEDLVLHDAHMDIRTPTHELTRAHGVLRARRQILLHKPDWALGRDGLRQLTGQDGGERQDDSRQEGEGDLLEPREAGKPDDTDPLADELAAIDAVLERAARVLESGGQTKPISRPERPSLVYDLDWDEGGRLEVWRELLLKTRGLPAALRAAILLEAWNDIEVLQHATWFGPLLVAALLRQEGVAGSHLACLHLGIKNIPRERRRARKQSDRLLAFVDAIHETALIGLKEHDRLMLAKSQIERRLRHRRASSRLPELVELVLSRPLVSTGMIEETLKVSKQGALNLVGELSLREMTGRGRFRAWGIV